MIFVACVLKECNPGPFFRFWDLHVLMWGLISGFPRVFIYVAFYVLLA